MAWMKLHDTVFGHRKTRKMSLQLGMPCVPLTGHLAAIWCWALDKTEDGSLPDFTAHHLEAAAEWEGAPGALVQAMIDSHYIDLKDGVMVLHDWLDYAGNLIQLRVDNAERQRRFRRRQKEMRAQQEAGDAPSDDKTVTESNGRNALRNAKVTRNAPREIEREIDIYNPPTPHGGEELSLSLDVPKNGKSKNRPFEAEYQAVMQDFPRQVPSELAAGLPSYAKRRKAGEITREDGARAVRNYARYTAQEGTDRQYMIRAYNFWGKEAKFKLYLAEEPAATAADEEEFFVPEVD